MERVLLYEEALGEVLQQAAPLGEPGRQEQVDLPDAWGRVLAEPLAADRDQPPFARSTRDGYAVRAAEIGQEVEELRLVGMVRAGERWTGPALQPGESIEIMTGAPLPPGATGVLMVEHARTRDGRHVVPEAGRQLKDGENVVPAGAEARIGAELVPRGRRLTAAEVGLAASCGYTQLTVYARPRVAIVATGDELVELRDWPETWQIRNSNSYSMAAMVQAEGGTPLRLAIARDTETDLQERLAEALQTDLILFSGGVSMGKYDLVEQVLRNAGAEFFFTGAKIQPGRPIVFGRVPRPDKGWTYLFGLPGNPVSTEVCFRLFAAPFLRALAGQTDREPQFAEARLAEDVRGGARVTRFLPAQIQGNWSGVTVRVVPWQGSGDLAANARANGFVVFPLGVDSFRAGETVRVLLR